MKGPFCHTRLLKLRVMFAKHCILLILLSSNGLPHYTEFHQFDCVKKWNIHQHHAPSMTGTSCPIFNYKHIFYFYNKFNTVL